MKTGLIIEAEETDKGLNNFCVKRTFVEGESWVKNHNNSEFNIEDADEWIDLMIEGIVTVIYSAHENKIKDSAVYLREVIKKLEQSFIMPSITSTVASSGVKKYKIEKQ